MFFYKITFLENNLNTSPDHFLAIDLIFYHNRFVRSSFIFKLDNKTFVILQNADFIK
jgi:hypothetical protein